MSDPCAEQKIDFYGQPDDEQLIYTDPDAVIEAVIDGMVYAEWPVSEVTVIGFQREPMDWFPSVLEGVLEQLDEEYGGEDYTEPNEAMKLAETQFIEAIKREYQVWRCEPVKGTEITVNVLEWVKSHRPEWLETER